MFHTIEELRSPISALPDVIRDSGAWLKSYFDENALQLMEEHNKLVQSLKSYEAGDSGAHHIGSEPIAGVSGITVRQQLEDLKQQVDQTIMGTLPDGSVSAQKLEEGAAAANIDDGTLTLQQLAQEVQELLASPGDMKWRAADTAPAGWLLCDGTAYDTAQYSQLYQVIGTAFNTEETPDGMFCVPDMRGRGAMGVDLSVNEFNLLGKTDGERAHKLTVQEMPSHRHEQIFSASATAVLKSGTGRSPMANNMDTTTNATAITYTGGSKEHNNLQPYIALHCFIKY